MKITLLLLLFMVSTGAVADRLTNTTPILSDSPAVGEPGAAHAIVIDVVLHDRQAILNMLKRAEKLAITPNHAQRPRQIALVLHGREIEHFRISKYNDNRDIVDLAAKLDAFNIIDVKMCGTMMRAMNIDKQEVPAFIEIVPYGPAEVRRLEKQGFIKL